MAEKNPVGRPRKHYTAVGNTDRCYRPPKDKVSVIPSSNPKRPGNRIPISSNYIKIKPTNKELANC